MTERSYMIPDVKLITSNEFYLFYEMMVQSLKEDDVKEGISRSLHMLRMFLKSGNIALFRKNKDGVYVFKMADSKMNDLVQPVSCIVNKTSPLIEQKEIFNLGLNLGRLDNLTFIYEDVESNDDSNDKCIVAIVNNNKENDLDPRFYDMLKDTMQIILKRAASYERNTKAISTDLLTGLDNRNSYELRLQQIDETDNNIVMGIFDLFRLKYVNDNFTHNKGDEYIQKAANVLNKYWPKQKVSIGDDGIEKRVDTGHCVYRIGGDEFVLITTVENLQLANIKAKLAQDEISMIDLGLSDYVTIGINYGIVQHDPIDTMKETFSKADSIMQEEKNETYKKLRLERRHQ